MTRQRVSEARSLSDVYLIVMAVLVGSVTVAVITVARIICGAMQ